MLLTFRILCDFIRFIMLYPGLFGKLQYYKSAVFYY